MPVIRKPIGSAEELQASRLPYIGASEIASVCGIDGRFASRAILFAEKMGLRPPQPDTAALRKRWGELGALEALQEHRPDWLIQRARVQVIDEELRMSCCPDAAAIRPDREGPGIVQCKTIGRGIFRRKWLDDPEGPITGPATPPPAYQFQTIDEMMLNDTSWGGLAVLIVGEYAWDFQWIEVERNAVVEDRMRYCVKQFFEDYLDPGIMPPLEPAYDDELVKALYPKDDGTTIDLTGDNYAMELVEELTEVGAALKRNQKREKEIKVELQGKLADHTYGLLADGRYLSWKQQHRKAYSVEAADFRVLRVHKAKGRHLRSTEDDE